MRLHVARCKQIKSHVRCVVNPKSQNHEKTMASSSNNWNNRVHVVDYMKNLLTAGVSSAIAVSVMAPAERVKLILQVQDALAKDQTAYRYTGLRDTVKHVIHNQGYLSLWRGNTASIYRAFPYQAVNFATKDLAQKYLHNDATPETAMSNFGISLLSGGMGGAAALTIVYPLDLARMKLAVSSTSVRYSSSKGDTIEKRTVFNTIRSRYKKSGIIGVYRGYVFSIVGVFWYRALFFGIYDLGKIVTPKEYRNLAVSFAQAEAAACISGFLSYPCDTVRRRMMLLGGLKQQMSIWDTMKKIYKKHKLRGFFLGAGVNMIRQTGGALTLVLYDQFQLHCWGRSAFEYADVIASPQETESGKRAQ